MWFGGSWGWEHRPLLAPSGPRSIVHSSIVPKGANISLTSSSDCSLLSIPTNSFRSARWSSWSARRGRLGLRRRIVFEDIWRADWPNTTHTQHNSKRTHIMQQTQHIATTKRTHINRHTKRGARRTQNTHEHNGDILFKCNTIYAKMENIWNVNRIE